MKQSSFTSFSPKITELDINSKWKYNITVIWMQFLTRRIYVLGILNVSSI